MSWAMMVVEKKWALFVDDTHIERHQFCSVEFRQHSFWVIPGTLPVEFECHSKFCWNHFINLAGPSAKFDSSGIPGIARIPLDSSRNQPRTVKTSNVLSCVHTCISALLNSIHIMQNIHQTFANIQLIIQAFIQLIIQAFIQHFIHITPRSSYTYIAKDHAQAHAPVFICSHQSSLFVHNLQV